MPADESADGAGSAALQTARATGQSEPKHALLETRRGGDAGRAGIASFAESCPWQIMLWANSANVNCVQLWYHPKHSNIRARTLAD